MEEERDNIIELTDENGDNQQFEHLDTIEKDGTYYVALVPVLAEEPEDGEEEEVYIMKLVADKDGNEMLTFIEDDNELNEVFQIFDERYQESYIDDLEEETED